MHLICRLLNVSRSSYYWLTASPLKRQLDNKRLSYIIKKAFLEGRATYGSRRIRHKLIKLGEKVSRLRVINIMKENQLICKTKKKFKVTTDSNHK